jgi:2-dehydro-3-deoxy-L-rhamnonate dehydrogenase (NAD+)
MKRCGTLEEIADMAAFIVSPQTSFTTGFTFDLSGGRATY